MSIEENKKASEQITGLLYLIAEASYLNVKIKNVMKNLLKKIFGSKKQESPVEIEFSIEYYPITNRYYPKYGNRYLRTDYATGFIVTESQVLFNYCDYTDTEAEADEMIERFKEQQKVKVQIIKR